MGGLDKGWVELGGKPLIRHLLERLQPQAAHILINANRNLDDYASLGCPIVHDRLAGFPGPLAGFAALLHACKDEWLAVLPCDSPLLPEDYLQRLLNTAEQNPEACIVTAHDGEHIQPVHALIASRLLADLESFLQSGGRRVALWYDRHPWVAADFSDCPEIFANLNRPTDFEHLESLSSGY
ncbi:MAG TPA: molybdenum cofactor guanylyltransferase [Thiotrichales bacterium]|nr:molybdenum cofactor guanylyltransferase [Thiotrichales bacterium]